MLAPIILALGVLSRLVVHAPNFTPVIALALFGGVYLNKKYALIVPLALMVITDLILGLHNIILFTWGSVLLIAALGLKVRARSNMPTLIGSSLFSAVLFFVITNFGAWLVMYPHNWDGLVSCYIAAIPFFRNMLSSTLIFSFVFFGLYAAIAHLVKDTRYAKILLAA